MDQLPKNSDNGYSALRKDHPLDEKGVVSVDGDSDAITTTQPYRLYKRRWIGVFAMVSTLPCNFL